MKTPPKQRMVRPFSQKKDNANRRLNFLTGLIIAMTAVLFAFNWKTPLVDTIEYKQITLQPIDEDIIPITVVKQEKKQPQPEDNKEKPKSDLPVSEKQVNNTVSNTIVVRKDPTNEIDLTSIELPELLPENVEAIPVFTIVEDMPAFKGCEDIQNKAKRELCTQLKIFEFMNKNQRYPEIALEGGMQGTVYVSFEINTSGKVDNVNVLKGVAGASVLDKEAKRLVESFPDFIPGEQRGKKVRVRLNIPINFKLL